ncbi:hypothetical protein [Streptomyces sp. NPDC058398]|uniref:hypothetical protein n=1 Tax=Streptomyces sp. NPDC058398 TaxID=3346479 RepID=UPI00365FEBAA
MASEEVGERAGRRVYRGQPVPGGEQGVMRARRSFPHTVEVEQTPRPAVAFQRPEAIELGLPARHG